MPSSGWQCKQKTKKKKRKKEKTTSSSSVSSPFLFLTEERHLPLPPGRFVTRRTAVLPPEDRAEDEHHEIDPGDHHPLAPRDADLPLPLLPLVADLQEPLRVVRDDAIEALVDAPPHHVQLVDRPRVQRPPSRPDLAHEARAEVRQHEGLLQHVEGDVGDGEEFARVRDGEADVRDWEGRKVLRAEGEELDGPASED